MGINKLYESIDGGLDRIIKKLSTNSLLEKKQEISPEDERDNELIRSAMTKRKNRFNAKLTPEEKDALKRNNIKDDKRTFITPNGYVDVDSYYNQPRIVNASTGTKNGYSDSKARVFPEDKYERINKNGGYGDSNYRKIHKDPEVNLADMGRKQKERVNNRIKNIETSYHYGDWNTPQYVKDNRDFFQPERGAKKSYRGRDTSRYDAYRRRNVERPFANLDNNGNFGNRLDAERYEVNKNLQKNYKSMQDLIAQRNGLKKNREEVYGHTDSDRQVYLKEIERYKQLLRDLDSREESNLAEYDAKINDVTSEMRQLIDGRKKNKSESFRRNKRYKRI